MKLKAFGTSFLYLLLVLSLPAQLSQHEVDAYVNVSNNPDNIDTLPAIAVDKDNYAHIVWNSFYACVGAPDGVAADIFYTNNKGGSFAAPVQISVPMGWYSRDPTVAVDSAGNAHIAFRRSESQTTILNGDDIYYVTNTDGSFDNPILLVDGGGEYSLLPRVVAPHFLRIHCDSQDNIHLLFMAYTLKVLPDENPYQGLIVYMNNINGVWSDPRLAVEKVGVWGIDDYSSCLDRQDHVHIVIHVRAIMDIGRDFIYYTNNTGGEFLTPILASVVSSEHMASEPDVAVDSHGYAHIVYRYFSHTMDTPSLFYVNNVSGSFSSWIAICEDKYYYLPSIAIDDSDFVHIAYKRWMHVSPVGGGLWYGNNISGDFDFILLSDLRIKWSWYPGSRYFVLGESSTIHFAFYDWIDSDTEIFYAKDSYSLRAPTNPSPPDGAIDISLDATLDWDSSNAASYDVYLGTSSPPPKVGTVTSSSYDPGTLDPGTTHYWKIIAKNEYGEISGSEWSFTTKLQLILSATSGGTTDPSPGTTLWNAGTIIRIEAIPDDGYMFIGWTGDAQQGRESEKRIWIRMDTNKSITANFSLITPPFIFLSISTLNFGATTTGDKTQDQKFRISNTGGGILDWSISDNAGWLSCNPTSGSGNALISASCNPSGLSAGTYNATITVSSTSASNSPQTIDVTLNVISTGASVQPFGSFDTPGDGTTGITGAIPVTGWVLDDVEATKVEIWRDPVGGEPTSPNGFVYIGDAVFVEGARPDVEQMYPDYPLCCRAGWGYMILTNFLPNQGNGTYIIHALAYDKEGNSVELGTKTITCDNANAVKPFGTIDTPTQGGEASGSAYVNFGWALTPQPNYIHEDGSTITVWIDGAPVGNPVYNQYRADIATLFPGYANSDGAVGYFYIDTTAYDDGVHTIAWSVEDSGGNTEGLGSRYFMILNTAGMSAAQAGARSQRVNFDTLLTVEFVNNLPVSFEPLRVRRGYSRESDLGRAETDLGRVEAEPDRIEAEPIRMEPEPDRVEAEAEIMQADNYGAINIEIREVERIEIDLGKGSQYRGYLIVGDQLRSLPIGSTLDAEKGIFSWQPGPGFIGAYDFVFVKEDRNGELRKIKVRVKIKPKFEIY